MIGLCEKYGFNWVWSENRPLGKKHNIGINEAYKLKWDYCLNIGSDDIVSSKIWDLYKPYFEAGHDIFGINDILFLDLFTLQMKYNANKNEAAFGAGRVVSRRVFEVLKEKSGFIRFWPDDAEKGLDSKSLNIARQNGFDQTIVKSSEIPYIIDMKSGTNIWAFKDFSGEPRSFDSLRKIFPDSEIKNVEAVHEKLQISKTMALNKTYRLTHLIELSLNVKVQVNETDQTFPVVFRGGQTWPQFKGGSYGTSNPAIQAKLEASPMFDKDYILEKTTNITDPITEEIPPAVKQEPAVVAPVDPPVEANPITKEESQAAMDKVLEPETPKSEETPKEEAKEEAPSTQEEPASDGPKVVTEVNTAQEASAWLRKNFSELKARDVNTKPLILSVATSKNVQFPNLK